MRLTAELIRAAPVYMNPLKQREINLRGFKIVDIENLGVTNDEYEVLDLSDNAIQRLENIPLLKRMNMILLSNNHINYISLDLRTNLPSLDTLILSNNHFTALEQLNSLALLTSLRTLSVMNNPVTKIAEYRSYIIHLLPNLKILDFNKIKPKEKDAALLKYGPPPTLATLTAQLNAASSSSSSSSVIVPEKVHPSQSVPSGPSVSLNTAYTLPSSFAPPPPSAAAAKSKLSADQFAAEKKRIMNEIAAAKNVNDITKLEQELQKLIQENS